MQLLRIREIAVLSAAVIALASPGGGVSAQPVVAQPNFHSGSTTGIGYTALFPSALVGVGAWHLFGTSRLGVFADAKMTVPSVTNHANYCPDTLQQCDLEWVQSEYNHYIVEDVEEWLVVNAGGMYAFTEEFALMLGVGMARERLVREFADDAELPEDRITWEGNYFVPFPGEPAWNVQATAGMIIRAGPRVAFSFGYETGAGNMNAGVYLVLH